MTPPELALWAVVRGRRLGGFHFRRQHPVAPYVLDFACRSLRLAVEVDGAGHDADERIRSDDRRTAFLERARWRVVRYAARDVLGNLEGVASGLLETCVEREALMRRSRPPLTR
jgi:very-short-patch-repair endonuclease